VDKDSSGGSGGGGGGSNGNAGLSLVIGRHPSTPQPIRGGDQQGGGGTGERVMSGPRGSIRKGALGPILDMLRAEGDIQ